MDSRTKPQLTREKHILENRLYRGLFIKLNKHIREQTQLINIQNEYGRLKGDLLKYNHGVQPHILTNRIDKLKDMSKNMGLKLDEKEYIK